jgi:cellobiose-specific phosphotransferase system component IIA
MENVNIEIATFFLIIAVGFLLMAWYDNWQRKRDEKFFDEMEKLMEESERKFNQALDEEMETLKKKRSSKKDKPKE